MTKGAQGSGVRATEHPCSSGDGSCTCTRAARLMESGEPYRLLFPFGVMIGIFGVILWPAFVYGWFPMHPGVMHARIMVQGFIFSFMAGFLGSALPHMLEVRAISHVQTLSLIALISISTILHAMGLTALADVAFSFSIVVLLCLVLKRWRYRKDLPPPGMVLAVLGVASGAIGSLLLAFHTWLSLPVWAFTLGNLLLYHGLLLFPVLGAGAYLLPRMVGLPNRHLIKPASRTPSRAWRRRALFMLNCGGGILISFILEVAGHVQVAYAVRAVIVLVCMLHEVPFYRARVVIGTIPRALVVAFTSIFIGYVLQSFWPEHSVTIMHISYIMGYGLLVMNIGARVMLGHSGQTEGIYVKSVAVRWVIGLAATTMATRISADLIPSMQWSHYAYAAVLWAVTLLLWLVVFGPLVTVFPPKDDAQA